jgi:uncharacterized protein (TIGR03118 family)
LKNKIAVLFAFLCLMAGLGCGGYSSTPAASAKAYRQTNLVADTAGSATHTDPGLLNPWGIAFAPGQPFWIAANNLGRARVFDPSGAPGVPVGIAIPTASQTDPASAPTGVVFNPIEEDFRFAGTPAQFLFATENGTVSTWAEVNGSLPSLATLALDNSSAGAVYKGLAIANPACCREFLALADFHGGFIATYTVNFDLLAAPGTFTDPSLPAGYAPFNIQQIGTQVFITYAVQDGAKHDPVLGAGNGIVSIFDQEGNFQRRLASNGPLNAPWGIAKASANFGPFSNAILIGNFGDGTINAFDLATGNFLGQLKDANGKVISNPGLWALAFRSDGLGDPNTLYFTAGSSGENHGLFGSIAFHN